jgi:hypothetical protein
MNTAVAGSRCESTESGDNMPLESLSILLRDSVDEEREIRELATKCYGDWVSGDSYYVPSIVDIVERLVQEVLELRGSR